MYNYASVKELRWKNIEVMENFVNLKTLKFQRLLDLVYNKRR